MTTTTASEEISQFTAELNRRTREGWKFAYDELADGSWQCTLSRPNYLADSYYNKVCEDCFNDYKEWAKASGATKFLAKLNLVRQIQEKWKNNRLDRLGRLLFQFIIDEKVDYENRQQLTLLEVKQAMDRLVEKGASNTWHGAVTALEGGDQWNLDQ